MEKEMWMKKLALTALSLLLCVIMVFVVTPKVSNPETHTKTMESIDNKVTTVLELAAASTATSAVVSALPDDTATPIAEKLADFSWYFMLILCVLYLEKYLITITGMLSFGFLLPGAILLLTGRMWCGKKWMSRLGARVGMFGLAAFLLIPLSVRLSDTIYATYQTSINQTIEAARDTTIGAKSIEEESEKAETEGIISSAMEWASTKTTDLLNQASAVVNHFLEAVAVMVVTSCVIPVLVLVFLAWMLKLLLGIDTRGSVEGIIRS